MERKSKMAVRGLMALALPMLVPVAAFAEPLVLAAPPEAPAATTQAVAPQNPAVEPLLANEKILILPFQPVNTNETKPWIGKSIQQSMVADLMALAPDRIVTADQFAATVEAAVALAQQHGARYVIAGGYTSTDKELRVTGELLDAQSGKAVTGLKVTGDLTQVFPMEDGLAMQVRARLFPASLAAPPTAPQAPGAPQNQNMVAVPQPPQSATATAADIRDGAGVYAGQPAPYYSSYATAPAQTIYGGDSGSYVYSPTPSYDYGAYYAYPDYSSYYPYYSYYPSYGAYYPGFGFGFFVGGVFHHGYDGHYHGGYGRGYSGGYVRGGVGVSSSFAYRGSSGFSASGSFGAPYRAQPFYSHSSFGHSGAMGSSHSFGGGGGFHGGGGGGMHGGGGHR